MKIGRLILAALIVAPIAAGCHGQVPPAVAKASLTWTAPLPSGAWLGCGTGQPACTYIVSRAVVASGTACPANTGTAYTPLNQNSPVATAAYVDATAAGYVCYVAQTLQGGLPSQPSTPSNNGVALNVPPPPGAPGMPSAAETSSKMIRPNETAPGMASPGMIVARLTR
jgi:hypothetical protein